MAKLPEALQACFPQQGPLADYVTWAHRLTHAPPAIHLACTLPLLSYELVRRGFTLPIYDTLTLWMGIIAPPGSAKTTCLAWTQDFSRDFYDALYGPDLAPKPWIALNGSLQGVLHAIAERDDKQLPLIAGILHHTEAAKVFFNEEAPATLCEIYDGRSIERNYRYLQEAKANGERAPIVIKSPRLSAILMTTQASLERVAQREMLEGGLFSRLLWLREELDELQPFPLGDQVGRGWLLQRWMSWARTLDGLRAGHDLQLEIGLTAEALEFLQSTLFERLKNSMRTESVEASVSLRAMPHAARVAAVFAASRLNLVSETNAQTGAVRSRIVIDLDDIVRAANFVLRSFDAAMVLGGRASATHTASQTKRDQLLQAIKKTGRVGLTRREAYQLFHGAISKKQLDDLVSELLDASLVEQGTLQGPRGRPAIRLFDIEVWEDVLKILKAGGSTTTQ